MVGGFREFARGCTLAGGMQSRAVRMSHVSFSYGGSTVLVDANLSVELFWVTIDERAARLAGVRVTACDLHVHPDNGRGGVHRVAYDSHDLPEPGMGCGDSSLGSGSNDLSGIPFFLVI